MHSPSITRKLFPFILALSLIVSVLPNWVARAQSDTPENNPVAGATIEQTSFGQQLAIQAGNSARVFLPTIFSNIKSATEFSGPTDPSAPLGVTGSWKLVFSDEFNGSSLDLGKWRPNWLGPSDTAITKPVNSNEQSCYDPAQVSVSGGSLKLTAVARTCSSWAYASGIVTTSGHFTFSHGFMEARLWLDGASSVKNWPAFWADGTGTWPTTGEIDVMEGLGGAPAWHYHWGSPSSPQQVGGTPPMSTRTGWHTFGADWESGVVRFYYDGKPVGQATQGVVDAQMFLILDYAVSAKIAGPIQVPSSLLVDYVRVWQH